VVTARAHGGPDARGAARWDFSTNANACGPCERVLHAVKEVDATRYPDPAYARLREALARFHGVDAGRIVVAGSGSEFVFRFTAWAARQVSSVSIPEFAYGDYAAAARAHGLEIERRTVGTSAHPTGELGVRRVGTRAHHSALTWLCAPSSPLGQADTTFANEPTIIDLAYEPLRLSGTPRAHLDTLWQLWTPNKALGLTGVRGAYAIAPAHALDAVPHLDALAPSWVLGAHGAAMLSAWCEEGVQAWLQTTRATLRDWKHRQQELVTSLGFEVLPSEANFFTCRVGAQASALAQRLRAHDVQVRDCTSFGLPGHWRLGVLAPEAQDALLRACKETS
jgi:histidinol-phosphate aminotransferase